jgi:hypothetical protein
MFRVRKTGSAKQSSIYSFPSGKMNALHTTSFDLVRIGRHNDQAKRCLPQRRSPKTKKTQAFGAILN